MKILVSCLFLVVMAIGFAISAYAQNPECNLKAGSDLPAAKQKEFETLLASAPDKPAVRYNAAIDYAQAGNSQNALSMLVDALAETPWLDPSTESAFQPLYGCAAFQKLVQRVEKKFPPVATSHVVRTIPQKDLIPEGLVSDPVDGTLYMSSIFHRKIVKIAPDGSVSDFVTEAQDGLLGVLGIKVDARDRSIWAASERRGESALFHFGYSGKTLSKYSPEEPGKHLFNDLVVTSHGDVFVTDSEDGSVYKLPQDAKKLVRLDLHKRLYPNGIALAADEKSIYVAHECGIVVMDLNGGSIAELAAPIDVSLAQVDGLYLRNGSLIAIQNGFGANRIVQLRLTPDGRNVSSGKLLEFRSSNLELPTTGTIYNDNFYFIVNTQIDHEENGKLLREEQLQPIKIAEMKLR
jgi:hypothetical protein